MDTVDALFHYGSTLLEYYQSGSMLVSSKAGNGKTPFSRDAGLLCSDRVFAKVHSKASLLMM